MSHYALEFYKISEFVFEENKCKKALKMLKVYLKIEIR